MNKNTDRSAKVHSQNPLNYPEASIQVQRGKPLHWFGLGVVVTLLVGVGMYFLTNAGKKPIQLSPSPVVEASPVSVSAASWQTYTNDLHSYQIKLPPDWKQIEHSSNFPDIERFQAVDGDVFEINVTNNESRSLESYIIARDKEAATGYEGQPAKVILSKKSVFVGEYSGIRRREEWRAAGFVTDVTYVGIGQKVFIFSIIPGGSGRFEGTEVYINYDSVLFTFRRFEQSPKSSPKTQTVKSITYQLPAGWQTVTDPTGTFEVGFDPTKYKSSETAQEGVFINFLPGPNKYLLSYMVIRLLPYSGGSRHEFIYKEMGARPIKEELMSYYHEEEYVYHKRSCLFLVGVSVSQFPTTWGMCDAGGGRAFLIGSYDDSNLLPTIQTIRLLK